jgi:hypothetical protein
MLVIFYAILYVRSKFFTGSAAYNVMLIDTGREGPSPQFLVPRPFLSIMHDHYTRSVQLRTIEVAQSYRISHTRFFKRTERSFKVLFSQSSGAFCEQEHRTND